MAKYSIFDYTLNAINIAFLFCCFVIVPLYFSDGYFNILKDKSVCVIYCSMVIICLFVLLIVVDKRKISELIKNNRWNIFDVSVALFLLSSGLSTFQSYNIKFALDGSQGYGVGFIVICFLVADYLIMRICYTPVNYAFVYVSQIITVFILLINILNCVGVDFLNMHMHLAGRNQFAYVSTLGNKNWAAVYVSMLICYSYIGFLQTNVLLEKCLNYILCLLSLANMIFLGVDSIVFSMIFSFGFLICFALEELKRIKDTAILAFSFGLLLLLTNCLPICNAMVERVKYGSYAGYFLNIGIDAIIIIVGISVYVLCLSIKNKEWENNKKNLKRIFIALNIILIIFTFVFFVKSFGPHFGNDRGMIWMESLRVFRTFPLKTKLFGTGPELLRNVYSVLSTRENIIFTTSHNVWIQTLLSMGVIGLAFYSIMWVSLLTNKLNNKDKYISIFIVYLAQTLIISDTPGNLLILLYFVVYSECCLNSYQK